MMQDRELPFEDEDYGEDVVVRERGGMAPSFMEEPGDPGLWTKREVEELINDCERAFIQPSEYSETLENCASALTYLLGRLSE